jgi:hypothetical protein
MRRGLTNAYSGLGYLIAALVVVQFFLAGLGIFGASSFSAHESLGFTLHGLTLLVVILAIAGPRTGGDIGMAVALLAITTLQVYLPETAGDVPELAAFHPVVALLVLGLSAHIGRRYLERGRASVGPA